MPGITNKELNGGLSSKLLREIRGEADRGPMDEVMSVPVHYSVDSIDFNTALLNKKVIDSDFMHPLSGMYLTTENYLKFLNAVEDKYSDITLYDYSESQRAVNRHYHHNEFIMYVTGNNKSLSIEVFCKTPDVATDIFGVYKKYHLSDDDITITMSSYYMNQGHVSNSQKILSKDEIQAISTSYYPYIDTDMMFKRFFSLQENILILTGAPGLGKSKMASAILKYATENEEYIPYDKIKEHDSETQYVYVASVKSTQVLSDDYFWRELEHGAYDFVILDDLDYFLTKRDSEVTSDEEKRKNEFLNQFLSFTDGIEKTKTKFIITTNQPFDDLDLALLRKGRLFDILELRPLKYNEALNIWKEHNLDEEAFNKAFKGDEILPADLGSEIAKHTNSKLQYTEDSYLKEEGISKIKKAQEQKKVGI